jgi:hypothetical protein|tara:strand:+ start:417 stop:623 length:207 start_codon:yes stop_codon:yes gene_type:complete
MRNGKYKAFYLDERQFNKVNSILKECQDLTLKEINRVYPGTKKVEINITEKDIMLIALENYLVELRSR